MTDLPSTLYEAVPPRNPKTDPLAIVDVGGLHYRPEDMPQIRQWQAASAAASTKKRKEQWAQTEPGKLCLELYAKFQEYKHYLATHPYALQLPGGCFVDFEEHKLFKDALRSASDYERDRAMRDRRNLERARLAARCRHVHTGGERCGCPRMRGQKLCYMHARIEEVKGVKLDLGPLEDADAIQLAIMKLQRAIVDGTLDHKQVSQLSYLIQLAAWNVTRTTTAMTYEPEEEDEDE